MNTAELYLLIQRTLKHYHYATLKNDASGAYQIAVDLVDLCQQLEQLSCDVKNGQS
jgi:hypothetical protein